MNVKMLVVQGRPAGKTLVFATGEYYFGRGAECHIRPNSEWVSRQHCLLRVTAEEAFLRDLGSRNGTLVNGKRIHEECRLVDGDQVQVGPLVLTVRFDQLSPLPRVEASESVSMLRVIRPRINSTPPADRAPAAKDERRPWPAPKPRRRGRVASGLG